MPAEPATVAALVPPDRPAQTGFDEHWSVAARDHVEEVWDYLRTLGPPPTVSEPMREQLFAVIVSHADARIVQFLVEGRVTYAIIAPRSRPHAADTIDVYLLDAQADRVAMGTVEYTVQLERSVLRWSWSPWPEQKRKS
jgi:hypothetical protein